MEAQFLGQLSVYALMYVVEVGMGGINGYVVLDGLDEGLLYLVGSRKALEGAKYHRVVGHYHVAAPAYRFIYYG